MTAGPTRTCVCATGKAAAFAAGVVLGAVVGALGAWLLIWLTQRLPT